MIVQFVFFDEHLTGSSGGVQLTIKIKRKRQPDRRIGRNTISFELMNAMDGSFAGAIVCRADCCTNRLAGVYIYIAV